eukprot:6052377-Amphidinium_carterae.1
MHTLTAERLANRTEYLQGIMKSLCFDPQIPPLFLVQIYQTLAGTTSSAGVEESGWYETYPITCTGSRDRATRHPPMLSKSEVRRMRGSFSGILNAPSNRLLSRTPVDTHRPPASSLASDAVKAPFIRALIFV